MALPPFQLAVDQHRDQLARFLAATVGPDDAQDCLQETLIAALRAYPRLRTGSNLRAWLFTIARNKALDEHRARARRPVPVLAMPEAASGGAGSAAPGGDDPELWALVRELPAKQRAAVVLRFVNDFSHREVAAVLDCSEEAARRSLHEGLGRLRREMA
jgi:DNA-directed RNA polymerase specialized sigma24 family protein